MDNWDEIRTAFHVARLGTVSGAAEALGVHHATVIRHVDALETRLSTRLFQRHARGYTPTEAGEDLMRVAQATDDQFAQLAGRLRGRGKDVSGELVITSLSSLAGILAPVLASFQQRYPDVVLRHLTGDRLFRLEYGEAHVAVRAGKAPEEPDNVVQPFVKIRSALYASRTYLDMHGQPSGPDDFGKHRFVGTDNEKSRAPFHIWMRENVPANQIVFRSSSPRAASEAVCAGTGIGFLPLWEAKNRPDLIEILPTRPEWDSAHWLVTHMDLHRMSKVQALLNELKLAARQWKDI